MQRAERESEMAEADEAFHLLLAEASQNAAIRAVFQMLRPYIHTMMVQNVSVLGADGCTAHLKIVAAIEARNSELAKAHMAEHLNRSMEQTNMLNYVKKLDAPADGPACSGSALSEPRQHGRFAPYRASKFLF